MGVTLVSISCLDSAGYAALFHDLCCRIFDSKKKQLAEIPANRGLYALKAPHRLYAGVAQANDPLTMEEIHSHLGHIAPEAIRQMLKDGVVTGLTLDLAHMTISCCESCEYAKATRKPIGKICDPPRTHTVVTFDKAARRACLKFARSGRMSPIGPGLC